MKHSQCGHQGIVLKREGRCAFCNSLFYASAQQVRQKFCSDKCSLIFNREQKRKIRETAYQTGQTSNAWFRLRFSVLSRDGFKCRYCGRNPDDNIKLVVDHIVPKAKGGTYAFDNLITACNECNVGKSDILLDAHKIAKLKSRKNIQRSVKLPLIRPNTASKQSLRPL